MIPPCDGKSCAGLPPAGQPYTTAFCRKCWLLANDEAFRRAWGLGEPARAPLAPGKLPECVHLGGETGERQQCGSCKGKVTLKVLQCALHGSCTVARQVEGLACCGTCADRQPRFRRHLLYHIYPRQSRSKRCDWRWNVQQMLERISLFDGRRVVAIVTDRSTDLADHVKSYFEGAGCEFVVMANDANLREVATHEALFSRLADCTGPEDAILWAHAKGVSNHTWPDQGATIELWTRTIYETYLDYWPVVAGLLARHPVAGSFLRRGKFWSQSRSRWHYSGSWCWYRAADLFGRDWRHIDRYQHGIEAYPSLHFAEQEAGVIFGNLSSLSGAWPYKQESWRTFILPMLAKWRQEHAGQRQEVQA